MKRSSRLDPRDMFAAAHGRPTINGINIAVCPIDWLTLCFVPEESAHKVRIVRGLVSAALVQEWHDARDEDGRGRWVNHHGLHPAADVNELAQAVDSISDDVLLRLMAATVKQMVSLVNSADQAGRASAVGLASRVVNAGPLSDSNSAEGMAVLLALTIVIEDNGSGSGEAIPLLQAWEYVTATARSVIEMAWRVVGDGPLLWEPGIGTANIA